MSDECPTCKRGYNDFREFPRVYVAGITTLTPDQVPPVVMGKRDMAIPDSELTTFPFFGGRRNTEDAAREYFREHPDQKLFHTEEGIYEKAEEWGMGAMWYRHNNSVLVRRILSDSKALTRYLAELVPRIGKEVEPTDLLPPWEQDSETKKYIVPDFQLGSFSERLEQDFGIQDAAAELEGAFEESGRALGRPGTDEIGGETLDMFRAVSLIGVDFQEVRREGRDRTSEIWLWEWRYNPQTAQRKELEPLVKVGSIEYWGVPHSV